MSKLEDFKPYVLHKVPLDPELAEDMMRYNGENRKLSTRRVNNIVRALRRGEAKETFDVLQTSIDAEGQELLENGQHRCKAVILTGISIPILLYRGIAPGSVILIDNNRPRSVADYMRRNGVANAPAIKNIVKFIIEMEAGTYPLRGSNDMRADPTQEELYERFVKEEEIFKEARQVGDRAKRAMGANVTAVAAFWYNVRNLPGEEVPEDLNDFLDKLRTGVGLEEGSPILSVRSQLSMANKYRPRLHYIHYALLVKAWNAYRDGDARKNIIWRPGGRSPEAMPEPR